MISVAMTTYNGEKYIKEQIYSILNQTHPVDEIIICDDCSSDNTEIIINRIQSENSIYRRRSMGYQDSGDCSCAFYIGSCHGNNRGSNKTIQKNVG